ncbi:PREDICTED: uncharacterized RNA-binding protein C17H9.04c-like [Tarenaya hassleriana]|uniref:uncharacterized RNA-binding protein C17H9.04c-like n=1 Tax=Tarenaya hassleriana TaxID=28532 RepID=UPI0008FD6F54|nr:PREDICTED: uncharacterized RNA-binding protein C17H9.04c-like [Tarenaya hassleriana]
MSRPGDWNCRSCSHLNFQRRESCQRCGDSRFSSASAGDFGCYGGRAAALGFTTGSDVRPGDWYCTVGNCGTHNFASRSCCFKCGAFKDDSASGAPAAPDGNPATGFALDLAVTNTTSQAEWSVSDAVPQEETSPTEPPPSDVFPPSLGTACMKEKKQRQIQIQVDFC